MTANSNEPSRFARRLAQRRALAAEDGAVDGPVPTAEERAALAAFAEDLEAVTALLHREIAAIGAGALEEVGALYGAKTALLERIALRAPLAEPFLGSKVAEVLDLRGRLGALKDAVAEDSALLERMAQATDTIVREVEKIRDRHSLRGLYGKSGRPLHEPAAPRRQVDKTI